MIHIQTGGCRVLDGSLPSNLLGVYLGTRLGSGNKAGWTFGLWVALFPVRDSPTLRAGRACGSHSYVTVCTLTLQIL